jgi:predicted glycosyltransferase
METRQSPYERIAIYSQDGFGLGHMRRTSAIAWQICQMNPNASVLTLSDSQLGQFFTTSTNHDYIKLPSIVKAGPGNWKASHLAVSFEEVSEMRQKLIMSTLMSFAPQVLLVDHMPHGAMGELLPALDALKETGRTQVVLGLRDILDDPAVITHRWTLEGAYDAIEQYYSRVLVYGMRDVYDVVSKYNFPDAVASQVRYTGYVSSLEPPTSAAKIRARYLAGSSADTRLIVAMAGGGADAYSMMSAVLDAARQVEKDHHTVFVLITGPFMPPDLIADLNKRARHLPVRVMESVDDTLSYTSAADLVIAMAGYNTSVEILRMKKPAILIPRAGPSAEQRTRARLFAARSWVDMIDPDDLTAEALSHKILSRLKRVFTIQPYTRPDLHGVTVAANQIAALMSEKEPV